MNLSPRMYFFVLLLHGVIRGEKVTLESEKQTNKRNPNKLKKDKNKQKQKNPVTFPQCLMIPEEVAVPSQQMG